MTGHKTAYFFFAIWISFPASAMAQSPIDDEAQSVTAMRH
jgi:hypothetical protein